MALHRAAVQSSYLAGVANANAANAQAVVTALKKQQLQLQAEFNRQLKHANTAVTALQAANRDIAAREKHLLQEIDYVTTHYRKNAAAQPKPLPACIFTNGFVGVYNGAIAPDSTAINVPTNTVATRANTAPSTSAVTESATAEASAAPLQPSAIGQRDILQHITQYGSRCQAIEAQLNQLLDYLQSINQGVMDGA